MASTVFAKIIQMTSAVSNVYYFLMGCFFRTKWRIEFVFLQLPQSSVRKFELSEKFFIFIFSSQWSTTRNGLRHGTSRPGKHCSILVWKWISFSEISFIIPSLVSIHQASPVSDTPDQQLIKLLSAYSQKMPWFELKTCNLNSIFYAMA